MRSSEWVGILAFIFLVSCGVVFKFLENADVNTPSCYLYLLLLSIPMILIISFVLILFLMSILFWVSFLLSMLFKKKVLLFMDKPYYYFNCLSRLIQRHKIRPLNYKNNDMDKIKELLKELGYEFKFNKFDAYNEHDNIEIEGNNLIRIADLENGTYFITKNKLIEIPSSYLTFEEINLLLKELGSKTNER